MLEENERYEMDDLDRSIERRKELIEQAKEITEDSDFRTVNQLRKEWNRIHGWESALEEGLEEEFEAYLDVYYAKRKEKSAECEAKKEALIAKAKELVHAKDLKKATAEMNELMEQWKQSGFCGKELDDKLWHEFNTARQAFFDAKHDHWEQLQKQFEEAKAKKEALIERAKEFSESDNFKVARTEFTNMMSEWKSIGNAGREFEQDLWNAFNEERQKFYQRQNEHYEQLKSTYSENYEKKRALVTEAQDIVYKEEFTREQTERMKQMSQEWKEIGFCGKDNEDKVWELFRSAMDEYFDGLRAKSHRNND